MAILSSFALIVDISEGWAAGVTYSDKFNPVTWEQATNTDNKPFVYVASISLAERATWDFMAKEKNVNSTMMVICPPLIV